MFYVQALQTDSRGFVDALVKMMLPLTLGWLALVVLLFGETDEAFANIYSTAVSVQNLVPRLSARACSRSESASVRSSSRSASTWCSTRTSCS